MVDISSNPIITPLVDDHDAIPYDPNSLNYSVHQRHITRLRSKYGPQSEQVRLAREFMAKVLPLAPDLWLEWINDELQPAAELSHELSQATESSRNSEEFGIKSSKLQGIFQTALSLVERAMTDYRSVDLSLKFMEVLVLQLDMDFIDRERFRHGMERAISWCGLDFLRASSLWKTYFSAELMFEDDGLVINVINRILRIPLSDYADVIEFIRSTMRTHEACEGSASEFAPPQNSNPFRVDWEAKQTVIEAVRAKVNERLEWEKALLKQRDLDMNERGFADGVMSVELERVWLGYLDIEQKLDPNRASYLHERMVLSYYLSDSVWIMYSRHCRNSLKDAPNAIAVLKRGIRNIPWSSRLFVELIRCHEYSRVDIEEAFKLLDWFVTCNGHSSFASRRHDIQMAIVECARRLFDPSFRETAIAVASASGSALQSQISNAPAVEQFLNVVQRVLQPENGAVFESGPLCKLQTFIANVLYLVYDRNDLGREIMERILKVHGKDSSYWLEYAEMERSGASHQDMSNVRSLFRRAISVLATEELIMEVVRKWHKLESLHSTQLEDVWYVQICFERRMQVLGKSTGMPLISDEVTNHTELVALVPRKKRKLPDSLEHIRVKPKASTITKKERRSVDERAQSMRESTNHVETQDAEMKVPDQIPLHTRGANAVVNRETEPNTVFVNNFGEAISEQDLDALFRTCNGLKDIRLVPRVGEAKSFAYVEFENPHHVEKALEYHKTKLKGFELWVRRSRPPPKHDNVQLRRVCPRRGRGKPSGISGDRIVPDQSEMNVRGKDAVSSQRLSRKPAALRYRGHYRGGVSLMVPRALNVGQTPIDSLTQPCLDTGGPKTSGFGDSDTGMELDAQISSDPVPEGSKNPLTQDDFRSMLMKR